MKDKVKKVMGEFKSGALKSNNGKEVEGRKQAIAIALSEQRRLDNKNRKNIIKRGMYGL